jgi:hypothetical protein
VKKASQTKLVPYFRAIHSRYEKAGRNWSGEIDAAMQRHVSFPT